jgi:hypothetical protein
MGEPFGRTDIEPDASERNDNNLCAPQKVLFVVLPAVVRLFVRVVSVPGGQHNCTLLV